MRQEQWHEVVIKKQPLYKQQVVNRMALPSVNLTHLAALARVEAEIAAMHEELMAVHRRWDELHQRQQFLQTQLMRARLKESVNGYVKLMGNGYGLEPTTTLKPTAGAIGRLVKVGRTRALVDFGEDLHTWYVPLAALGTVQDPLAGIRDADGISKALEHSIERLHQDMMKDDDLTDQERWEDEHWNGEPS